MCVGFCAGWIVWALGICALKILLKFLGVRKVSLTRGEIVFILACGLALAMLGAIALALAV